MMRIISKSQERCIVYSEALNVVYETLKNDMPELLEMLDDEQMNV